MLTIGISTAVSRGLSYGAVYTAKLLRRGQDLDRMAPWRAFTQLDARQMRPLAKPLAIARHVRDTPRDDNSNSALA